MSGEHPPTSNPISLLVKRLRARRDVVDHSANNGVRTIGPPEIELQAADTIERLRVALEGLHFHHKMFEPDCRKCQAALSGERSAPETSAHRSTTINGYQARKLLEFIDNDDECRVELADLPARKSVKGEDMEAGLYVWLTEYPEEGCMLLDERPSAEKASEHLPVEIQLQTEKELHAAWRKRAEEAERELQEKAAQWDRGRAELAVARAKIRRLEGMTSAQNGTGDDNG